MRIFVAGATGVIGRRLVPMLVADGRAVTAMVRSSQRAEAARDLGAEVAIADALDADAVSAAVAAAAPEAVIHQLTALPARIEPRKIERDLALNDRLRSEGTRHLVAAAQAAGVRRIVAQSVAFAYAPGAPGALHGEDDPLYLDAPQDFQRSARAIHDLETAVLGAGGVVLRYGYVYGPGSAVSREGSMCEDIARRRMPVVGAGAGVWSFVQIDDAARATVAALDERVPSGAYNIVDDDPAPVREWLPALAEALGARRPLKVPVFIARLAAGGYGTALMTAAQGASNARAKQALDWSPQLASWREGFRTALG
jgi:nucleoside-diphosphate-sugar epimerase